MEGHSLNRPPQNVSIAQQSAVWLAAQDAGTEAADEGLRNIKVAFCRTRKEFYEKALADFRRNLLFRLPSCDESSLSSATLRRTLRPLRLDPMIRYHPICSMQAPNCNVLR
jgi:hypothetical protein